MNLQLEVTLKSFLPEQTGAGKNGQWVKQDFLAETSGDYPKTICFTAWGDQVAEVNKYNAGQTLRVSFRIESREHNSRWYTDVKPFKIEAIGDRVEAENQSLPF
jgi:hypothetical protein